MIDKKELERILPQLHKRAIRLTRDTGKAEDLTQDTVTKMIEKQKFFSDGTNMLAWGGKVMYRIFCSQHRREGKRLPVESVWQEFTGSAASSLAPRIESRIDARSQLNDVFSMVTDPARRQVIALAAVGAEYKEIAEEMGTPIGTVMSRLHRARRDAGGRGI